MTAAEADDLHAIAYAEYSWQQDGSLVVRARLAPEDGALFVRGLEASRERLEERGPSAERGSAEPRRPTAAEALIAMAEASLAGGVDRSRGGRYQVVVHVDAGEGGSTLEDGPALARGTAERLACDTSVVEIVERNGKPLSVGRRTRTTARRGSTTLFCSARGTIVSCTSPATRCARAPTARWIRDPWGGQIPYVPRPPPGDVDGLIVRNRTLEIDADTCRCGDGDRMDLDLTVAALTRLTDRC